MFLINECRRHVIAGRNQVRTVGRLASVIVAFSAVIAANMLLFPTRLREYSWFDIAAEAAMTTLAAIWVMILDPNSVKTAVYRTLWIGSLLVFVGNLQDVMDEFLEVAPALAPIEDLGTPVGMVFITVGLALWLRSNREAYKRLKEHKELYERLSRTDALTQLFNYRHYYEQIRLEIERALRYDRSLSLLFLDIDDFKAYNDTYGHVAGDKVLRALGRVISTILRGNDTGYRYGGEEFIVVLPETDQEEARVVAERIRQDFASVIFEHPSGPITKTVSIGVTELRPGDDATSLTQRTDKAMYRAKLRGKNLSLVADEH